MDFIEHLVDPKSFLEEIKEGGVDLNETCY